MQCTVTLILGPEICSLVSLSALRSFIDILCLQSVECDDPAILSCAGDYPQEDLFFDGSERCRKSRLDS